MVCTIIRFQVGYPEFVAQVAQAGDVLREREMSLRFGVESESHNIIPHLSNFLVWLMYCSLHLVHGKR